MIIYVFQTFEQSTSYVREIKKRVRGFLLVSLTRANFTKCHVHAQLFETPFLRRVLGMHM